jgi:hypothetical protein
MTPKPVSRELWQKFKDRFPNNDSGDESAIDHKYMIISKIAEEHFEAEIAELKKELALSQEAGEKMREALETVKPWCLASHGHETCDIKKVQDALATYKNLSEPKE